MWGAVRLLAVGVVLFGVVVSCRPDAAERVEANKAVARRYSEEVGNKVNLAVIDEVLAENYIRHCQATGPDVHGREAMKALYREWHATFPDYHETIEFGFGEGDYVAAYITVSGTQKGPMGPFPPNGKVMDCKVVGIQRFENGKIAETWVTWDNLATLVQLGHLPPPPGAAKP
jgi:predicted ester cyclase